MEKKDVNEIYPKEANSISSDHILEKIMLGNDIKLENYIIHGDLNLADLDLSEDEDNYYYINSSIKIINSVIKGSVNFDNAIFLKSIAFCGSEFESEASFKFSKFIKVADFSSVTFKAKSTFWQAQFVDRADFSPTHVRGNSFLKPVQFKSDCNFEFVRFVNEADFSEAEFNCVAEFFGTKFDKEANFCEVKFSKPAIFIDAKFKEDFIFWDAKCSLLQMEWGTEIFRFHVYWSDVKDSLYCDDGPTYLSMIKSFRELEQFEDADDCYYEYRRWRQQNRTPGWAKFIDLLAWITCGYGVRPSYTIIFGFFTIFSFGIILELLSICEYLSAQPNTFLQLFLGYFHIISNSSFLYFLDLSAKIFLTGNLYDLSGTGIYVGMVELLIRGLIFALFVVVLTKKLIR